MSPISFLITAAFLLSLLYRFKPTFIVMMAFSVLLQQLSLIPGTIKMFEALSICAALIFVAKAPQKIAYIRNFPLKIPFILISLSLLISNYRASEAHSSFLAISIATNLLNVFIFWVIVSDAPERSISLYLKSVLIFATAIIAIAFIETALNTNPYIKFVNGLNLYTNSYIVTEVRYGYKRSQSLFSMHTTNGGISLLLFCTLAYIRLYTNLLTDKIASIMIIPSLVIVTFLSGARSAMIGFAICCTMFIGRLLRPKWIIIAALFGAIVAIAFGGQLHTIIESIADTEKVDGSNAEMRSTQYDIATSYMKDSFWFGNGIAYTWTTVLPENKEICGAESMWIPIMIEFGAFGIISYATYLLSTILVICRERRFPLIFFIVGFAVFNTMSSIPDVPILHLFVYLIVMLKSTQLHEIDLTQKQHTGFPANA